MRWSTNSYGMCLATHGKNPMHWGQSKVPEKTDYATSPAAHRKKESLIFLLMESTQRSCFPTRVKPSGRHQMQSCKLSVEGKRSVLGGSALTVLHFFVIELEDCFESLLTGGDKKTASAEFC